MKKKFEIQNSKGEPIVLNSVESMIVSHLEKELYNSTGYQVDITTLTSISKSITEQKFFTIRPSDYMPVKVGEHAWSADILTYREFSTADDFSTGIINTASANSRLADADAAVDAIRVPVNNWAKQITWTIPQLEQASRSGNWDIVSAKERSRKKNWDLGIQKVAFLGLDGNSAVSGLLTMSGITTNTAIITQYISSMNTTDFQGFLETILGTYYSNTAYTTMPTHFIIPTLDYMGLGAAADEQFPLKSKLERLLDVFKAITMNPNFKILPCAYSDEVNNVAELGKNRYTLLNYDPDTLRLDIPVDYTNTMQNTINGFQFQNVGYGQFTGCYAYRPLEIMYFDFLNATV